jgi:Bacterial sugar transferase
MEARDCARVGDADADTELRVHTEVRAPAPLDRRRPPSRSSPSWLSSWLHLEHDPRITRVLGRTSIPFDEMVKLDYLYVTNWSLWGDVRLILRTLPVVLRRSGAN